MPKVNDLHNGNYQIWCPGCDTSHNISTKIETARQNRDGKIPIWKFNGDLECPTFEPSINYVDWCHFFIKKGKIQFQDDCHHELKGQTVGLPEWPL